MQGTFNTSIGLSGEFLYGKRANVRLGFGCAGLMQVGSRRRRQALLAAAFEEGIRHFDVARMYGLGAAEAEIGRFARSRRDRIGIATKFGIEPPGRLLARAQAPARFALGKMPALKSALKRGEGGERPARDYDGKLARRSLETSLRELDTDYVDCLFVHDPGPADRVRLEDIQATCEELVGSGKIRGWGLSGEPDPCLDLLDAAGGSALLQVRDDVFNPVLPAAETEPPAIGFAVLASARPKLEAHLANEEVRRRWSQATGCDCGNFQTLAALLLREALDRNRRGGILVSTTKPGRIGTAVEAAQVGEAGGRDAAAAALRRCIEQDFGAILGDG